MYPTKLFVYIIKLIYLYNSDFMCTLEKKTICFGVIINLGYSKQGKYVCYGVWLQKGTN